MRTAGATHWSYFLRAETMHGLYSYLEDIDDPDDPREPVLHELRHGESFLEVLVGRVKGPGFFLMDEPEAALSFHSCLALVGLLDDVSRSGGQVVCATHSPLLSALPGAAVLEVGDEGLRPVEWADLELVQHWRRYLEAPQAYLRHIVGD